MKKRNTQTLQEVLQDFLQENSILSEKLAEDRLINSWKSVLGHLTAKYTSDIYIRRNILYVRLTSAVLRNELSLCKERLILKLNEAAGRSVINEIVFL